MIPTRQKLLGTTLAALLGWAAVASLRADGPARPDARTPGADAAVPFRDGEQLDYRVGWQNFLTAATARLRVVERRPFHGRTAWHLQAVARTVDPVRILYELDDQFDSYTDTVTLAGLQYETHQREQGQRKDSVVRMSPEGEPAGDDSPAVRVPVGTRDPLGAFYSLRVTDWAITDGVRMPVYDGKKLYELRVRRAAGSEEITVPAGTFRAIRLDLHVYERGRELQNSRFSVWLGENAPHVPVLIEAELPFGTFRVELERAR